MVAAVSSSLPSCMHTNHLFAHPLCENQSLLKRIAIVVFHILTLGVPWIIYSLFFSEEAILDRALAKTTSLATSDDDRFNQVLHEAIMRFADEQLKNHPEKITRTPFVMTERFPSGDCKILDLFTFALDKTEAGTKLLRLVALLRNYFCPQFKHLMTKKYAIAPWKVQAIRRYADACMHIAYAISFITMENLASHPNKHHILVYDQAEICLIISKFCPDLYKMFRYGILSENNPENWNHPTGWLEPIFCPKTVSPEYTNLFYQSGTRQYKWRLLNNNISKKQSEILNIEEVRRLDTRNEYLQDSIRSPWKHARWDLAFHKQFC